MKKTYIIIFALMLTLVVLLSGCGLTSGSVFVKQEVDGRAYVDHQPGAIHGGGSLDTPDNLEHCTVNMTDNSDWGDVTIEDFEMMCIVADGQNHLDATGVSGEVWVVLDTTAVINTVADIVSNGGVVIFSGMALNPRAGGGEGPGTPGFHHFTCEETQELIQNRPAILAALKQGYFTVWVRAGESAYCFNFYNIVVGSIIVGSI